MRRNRWMRSAVAVAGSAGALAAFVAGPAQAAVPVGTAAAIALSSLDGATITGSRIVGSTLYVSHGNEVSLFNLAGKHLSDITGITGAGAPVASTDGTRLFVPLATGKGVAVITTATGAETTWAGTLSCVSAVAVAGGRLFMEAGCGTSALSSVSAADGTGQRSYADTSVDEPHLAGAAGVLAVGASVWTHDEATDDDEELGTYTTYSVGSDGTLTKLGSNVLGMAVRDLALSSDGKDLAVAIYQGVIGIFQTGSMSAATVLDMVSDSTAVAWSPDGTKVAAGTAGANGDSAWVFDSATHSALSESSHLSNVGSGKGADVLSGTMQYSTDGSLVYSLAQSSVGSTNVELLISGGGAVTATPLTLSVTAKAQAGKAVTVKGATLPGRVVTVTITASSGVTTVKHVRSDAKGAYKLTFTPKFSGTVSAYVAGDPSHLAATKVARYSVVAVPTITMTGYRSSSGGVLRYTSHAQVQIHVAIVPGRATDAALWLQYRDRHGWHDYESDAVHFATNSHGRYTAYLADIAKNVVYRVKAKATAHNSLSLPSGFGYGKPFTIR